jgi:hypothetical protein
MNFEQALSKLKDGEKITRKHDPMWEGYFLSLVQDDGEHIWLFDKDGWVDTNHAVMNSDLLAEDWGVVE